MAHEFKDDTLDDIRARDVFNLEIFLSKKTRVYRQFDSRGSAREFMGMRVNEIMEKLGVSIHRAALDKNYDIEVEMAAANIKAEPRVYDEEGDKWRSGMYIYKDNEIAGFVGFPILDPSKFLGYSILCTERI